MANVLDDVAALLHGNGKDAVSLGDLANAAGERGFGVLFVLFALPMVLPIVPPGTTTAVGILFSVLALQMLVGRRKPWLPRSWRHREVSPGIRRFALDRAFPLLSRLTRWSRPRWMVMTSSVGVACAALCALAMGLILILPIPFVNTLPAVAVLCIGLGLIGRDGIFLTAGIGVSGLVLALLILAVAVGGPVVEGLLQWLPGSVRAHVPF